MNAGQNGTMAMHAGKTDNARMHAGKTDGSHVMNGGMTNGGGPTTKRNQNQNNCEIPEIIDEGERCGWGSFSCRSCQKFRSPKWVLFWLSFAAILQGFAINGLINVVISNLEKRFHLKSSHSGIIPSCYDIAALLASFPVSYYGGRGNKPMYVGVGVIIMGLGSLLFCLPHFTTGEYELNQVKGSADDVCFIVNSTDPSISTTRPADNIHDYKWVFIVAQLLHGVGACPMWILGVTYLDENLMPDQSSLYIGTYYAFSVIGPALGYLGGGSLLDLHTDIDVPGLNITITSDHPNFVGNWWLGFLINSFFCFAVGFILIGFPKVLPGYAEKHANRPDETYQIKSSSDSPVSKSKSNSELTLNSTVSSIDSTSAMVRGQGGSTLLDKVVASFQQFTADLWTLFQNPVWVLVGVCASAEGFVLAAFAAFLPKFFESQIDLTPAESSQYVGAVVIIFGSIGMFSGGYIVKRFDMKCSNILLMCSIITFFTIPQVFSLLIRCKGGKFQGVNYAESNNNTVFLESDTEVLAVLVNSSLSCDAAVRRCQICQEQYQPVCGSDDVMYFSACHAGCQKINTQKVFDVLGGRTKFTDCICTGDSAITGKCSDNTCSSTTLIGGILFLLAITIFPMCLVTMPAMSATLRCVEPHMTSVAVGIQLVIGRLFGTIPGPPVYGAMFDNACLRWSNDHLTTHTTLSHEDDSDDKFCLYYDKDQLALSMTAVALALKIIVCASFSLAWYLYRRNKLQQNEADAKKQDQTDSQAPEGGAATPAKGGKDNPVFVISYNNTSDNKGDQGRVHKISKTQPPNCRF